MYKLFFKDDSLWYNIRQIRYLPYAIKYRWQRAWRGWADCDVWCMDGWFEEIVPQMLQKLKETKWGFPITDMNLSEEENKKLWDDALDRMIYLSKEMNEETCSEKNEIWEEHWEKVKSGCRDHMMDSDAFIRRTKEVQAYRDKCRKEFFELFCEHFESLWD